MQYTRNNGTNLFRFSAVLLAMLSVFFIWEGSNKGSWILYITGGISLVCVWILWQSRAHSILDTETRIISRSGRFLKWSWIKEDSLDNYREVAVTFSTPHGKSAMKSSPVSFHVMLMHKASKPIEKSNYLGKGIYLVKSFAQNHKDAIQFAEKLAKETKMPVKIDSALQKLLRI